MLRTYPAIRPKTPYAPHGERSVARGYRKAFRRARRLMYLEDQYMWSPHIARLLADALRSNPELHLIVVVPRHPDVDGRFALPPNEVGRLEAIQVVPKVAPDRVHVFDLENPRDTPIYVHAKVCVIDDVWACAAAPTSTAAPGATTASCRARCWTTTRDDREPARPRRARRRRPPLRPRPAADADARAPRPRPTATTRICSTPDDAVRAVTAAADALDAWHAGGRVGPRPPGRLRAHRPRSCGSWTRVWAVPAYRLVYDPDGRSVRDRLRSRW